MTWWRQSINRSRSANILIGTLLALRVLSPSKRGIEAMPTHREVCALSANTDIAGSRAMANSQL